MSTQQSITSFFKVSSQPLKEDTVNNASLQVQRRKSPEPIQIDEKEAIPSIEEPVKF